jgi:NAD(P)-dependent dehydrogenase (short-subunit alcohol dehydrogenase family)
MVQEERVIVVTGASSGIGKAVAEELARFGYRLILVARNEKQLMKVKESLANTHHSICPVDLTDEHVLELKVSNCIEKTGKISGLVHCAGVERTIPFSKMNLEVYKSIFDINVFAGFELARILSKKKYMDALHKGSFVFIGSIMSLLGQPGKVGYCSSKSALVSGVKAMALELAQKQIRCNCILPGLVDNDMTQKMFQNLTQDSIIRIINNHPLGLGSSEDVAYAVSFLIDERSKWITGTELIIDGGYSAQ